MLYFTSKLTFPLKIVHGTDLVELEHLLPWRQVSVVEKNTVDMLNFKKAVFHLYPLQNLENHKKATVILSILIKLL